MQDTRQSDGQIDDAAADSRRWISQSRVLFVNAKIDEIGRMTGGRLKSL